MTALALRARGTRRSLVWSWSPTSCAASGWGRSGSRRSASTARAPRCAPSSAATSRRLQSPGIRRRRTRHRARRVDRVRRPARRARRARGDLQITMIAKETDMRASFGYRRRLHRGCRAHRGRTNPGRPGRHGGRAARARGGDVRRPHQPGQRAAQGPAASLTPRCAHVAVPHAGQHRWCRLWTACRCTHPTYAARANVRRSVMRAADGARRLVLAHGDGEVRPTPSAGWSCWTRVRRRRGRSPRTMSARWFASGSTCWSPTAAGGSWRCRSTSITRTGSRPATSSTSTSTCATSRSRPGTRGKLAEEVARIHRATARPQPAAVGAVGDSRHRGRARGPPDQDSPRRGRDGASGSEILGTLFDKTPESNVPPPRRSGRRSRSRATSSSSGAR